MKNIWLLASILICLSVLGKASDWDKQKPDKVLVEGDKRNGDRVISKRQLDFDGGGGGVNDYVNGDVEVLTYITGDVLAGGEEVTDGGDYDHYDADSLDFNNEFWRTVSIFMFLIYFLFNPLLTLVF
jgi:hypothetical protein